jgi:hypothetical protein
MSYTIFLLFAYAFLLCFNLGDTAQLKKYDSLSLTPNGSHFVRRLQSQHMKPQSILQYRGGKTALELGPFGLTLTQVKIILQV